MRSLPVLPELPQNSSLLDYRRGRAKPATNMALGEWELNTHPDLMDWLSELASDQVVHTAYGVPVLASEGIAAVVALGTSTLLVRVLSVPEDIKPSVPIPPLTDDDWRSVDAWQGQFSSAIGKRRLTELVHEALAYARSLAS